MQIKTGNYVKDDVLKAFRSRVSHAVKNKQAIMKDEFLGQAIREISRYRGYAGRGVREACPPDSPEILEWCDKIIISEQKAFKALQIRKATISVILNGFLKENGLEGKFEIKSTYATLFICLNGEQMMRFKLTFKKIESGQCWEPVLQAVSSLNTLSDIAGRIIIGLTYW